MSLSVITLTEKPNMLYYLADELKKINPLYFAGTSKTIRKIIERKNIPNTEYTYATTFKKQWKICDTSCKKGKLLLNKNWCDINIQLNQNTIDNKKDIDVKDDIEEDESVSILQEQILEAPSILTLEEHEKFRDSDGKIIEIETRGEKNEDKIYFKVKDVSLGFNLPNLNSVLLHTDKGFERNTDYVTFNRSLTNEQRDNKKPSLYLTYNGFLRVLFVSRNQNAKQFRKWAEKILFTCQFGSKENKEKLGTKILNMDIETYRNVFKTHSTKLPCIYLSELGKVKDLKDTFEINDDIYKKNINSAIYKFGFTDDIDRRLSEHQNDYGTLKNVNLQLVKFTMIEQKYIKDAENDLRDFFEKFNKRLIVKIDKKIVDENLLSYDSRLNNKNRYELIILNKDERESVFKYYKYLGNEYAGSTSELQNKIEKMKHEIELIKLEKEKQKDGYENELLRKELEILKLQHEKENYKNMYEYTLKEKENKDEIYKLQIENYKLQLQLNNK